MKKPIPYGPLESPYQHISHRGASGEAPENTLTAFEIAVETHHTDVLEMDVHATKDGEIVVIHDKTVDRTTNGCGAIKNFTLRELKKLDAGYRFCLNDINDFPFRGHGISIPTLNEVFDRFPNMKFNIDIKQFSPSIEERVVSVIREHNREQDILLGSSDYRVAQKLLKIAPNIASFFSRRDVLIFYIYYKTRLLRMYTPRHAAIQTVDRTKYFELITPDFVNAVHNKGLKLHVWTINDENEMGKLLNIGIDGIMTDYPDRLNNVLKKMGLR